MTFASAGIFRAVVVFGSRWGAVAIINLSRYVIFKSYILDVYILMMRAVQTPNSSSRAGKETR